MAKRKKHNDEQIIRDKPEMQVSKKIQNREIIKTSDDNSFYSKYKKTIWISIILLLTIIVYFPALDNEFLNWDDDRYITGNKIITEFSLDNIIKYFTEPYFVMYMPFTLLSYAFDYAIDGLNPLVFHIHNLFLHLVNTVLVFFFIFKLVSLKNKKFAFSYALIVTFLFGLHTIHIQSVMWLAERKDVLYSVYFLVSLIFYLKYLETKSMKFILFSLAAFLISVMTKGQAVALSLSIVAIDVYYNRNLFDKKLIIEKIPFFVISAVFGAIALIAQEGQEPFADQTSTVQVADIVNRSFFENFVYAGYAYTLFLFKTIIPNNLSILHAYPVTDPGVIPGFVWIYTIPTTIVVGLLIYFYNKSKDITFGILFFTFNLILVLQIISDQPFLIAEHYTYMSSIGVFFLFGLAYQKIKEYKEFLLKPALGVFVVYLLFLSIFTLKRNDVFQNSETVWTDVIEQYPQAVVAFYNRGNYRQEQGDKTGDAKIYQTAIDDYNSTINLNPKDVGAYSNRGVTRGKLGDAKGALADFDKVVEIDSTYSNVYSNRGNTKIMLGQYQSAIGDYSNAIKRKPDFIDAIYNRGIAYANVGQFEKAIEDLTIAINSSHENETAYLNRAMSYLNLNKFDECESDCNLILKTNPKQHNAYFYLALIEEQRGNTPKAREYFDKINEIQPDFVKMFIDQGQYFEGQKQYNTAIEKYNRAIEINPNFSDTYVSLGVLMGMTGDMKKAIQYFDKAIEKDPANPKAFSNRGFANDLQGNYELALKDYSESLKLNPNFENTYLNRGILYNKQNKLDQALLDLSDAIRINPNLGSAYFNRGIVLYKMGKNAESCSDFTKASQLGVNDALQYLEKYCK